MQKVFLDFLAFIKVMKIVCKKHPFCSSFISFSSCKNKYYRVYMNVLSSCIKWMLYHRRPSFSGLELYASYDDWQCTTPKHTLQSPQFAILFRIPSTCITWKPHSAYNSITYQMTPVLLRMLCIKLKATQSIHNLQATALHQHPCLVICAQVWMAIKLRMPLTVW